MTNINNWIIFLLFLSFVSDFTEEISFPYPAENTDSKVKAGRKSPGSAKERSSCRCSASHPLLVLLLFLW